MSDSKIIDRVRKLLSLAANDAAAEGEVENALRAARHLMLAHQISEDDVAAPAEDWRTPAEIVASTEYGTARSWAPQAKPPRWYGVLARAIAEFVGTVKVYANNPEVHRSAAGIVRNDGQPCKSYEFYGPYDDCLMASELHQEIVLTCATMAKLRFGGSLMTGAGRDYCDGFASGLYRKIEESNKVEMARIAAATPATVAAGTSSSTALTLVRATDIMVAKKNHAEVWLAKEKKIKLGKSYARGRSISDSGAYNAGKTDGASQSLSKTRTARLGSR